MAEFRRTQRRYRKVRTVKRPKKRPEKCHVVRIRPDHVVMAKTAARMTCAAIRHGATKASIDREVQLKCNVGQPECDCERILLTLRQVLTIAASVGLALAVIDVIVVALPLVLRRIPLIGTILGRIATTTVLRQLSNEARTIEGVFVRVREEVALIERQLVPR